MISQDVREKLDPDGKYIRSYLTAAERIAAGVLTVFPDATVQRTRDVLEIAIEEERGCVLLITAEAVEIRLPTVEWVHPHEGRPTSRAWKRLREGPTLERRLPRLIAQATAARAAEFQVCSYCGESFPRERMLNGDVCHSCASVRLGVVF